MDTFKQVAYAGSAASWCCDWSIKGMAKDRWVIFDARNSALGPVRDMKPQPAAIPHELVTRILRQIADQLASPILIIPAEQGVKSKYLAGNRHDSSVPERVKGLASVTPGISGRCHASAIRTGESSGDQAGSWGRLPGRPSSPGRS